MLYVHKLHQLTPKTAELESVYLIREIKDKLKLPLSEEQLNNAFSEYLVSDTDKEKITLALGAIQPISEKITALLQDKDPLYEGINLERTLGILNKILPLLHNNLLYAEEIAQWQNQFIPDATLILNKIPLLRLQEEKKMIDERLQRIFHKILRNPNFKFNAFDIINEGGLSLIVDLCGSMDKGFFFHIPLEEEIKKKDFSEIKKRIPSDKLTAVEAINQQLLDVKKGAERAYDMNMRIMTLSLHFFACIKWANSKI